MHSRSRRTRCRSNAGSRRERRKIYQRSIYDRDTGELKLRSARDKKKICNYILPRVFTRFLFPLLFRHCFSEKNPVVRTILKIFSYLFFCFFSFAYFDLYYCCPSYFCLLSPHLLSASPRARRSAGKNFPKSGPVPVTRSGPRHSFWLSESCAKSRSRVDPAGSSRRGTRSHVSYV